MILNSHLSSMRIVGTGWAEMIHSISIPAVVMLRLPGKTNYYLFSPVRK